MDRIAKIINSTSLHGGQQNVSYEVQRRNRVLLKQKDYIMTKNSFRNRVLANVKAIGDATTRYIGKPNILFIIYQLI